MPVDPGDKCADEDLWYAAAAANSGEIRVDPLQRLHTLQNLASLLGPAGDGVPSVPRTLRDANLQASRPGCAAHLCAALARVTCAGWWTPQLHERWPGGDTLHGPHNVVCSGMYPSVFMLHLVPDMIISCCSSPGGS